MLTPQQVTEHLFRIASLMSKIFLGVGLEENVALKVLYQGYIVALMVFSALFFFALAMHLFNLTRSVRAGDPISTSVKGMLVVILLFILIVPVTPRNPWLSALGLPEAIRTDPFIVSSGVTYSGAGLLSDRVMQMRMPTFWWLVYLTARTSLETAGRIAAGYLEEEAQLADQIASAATPEDVYRLTVKTLMGIDVDERCNQEQRDSREVFRDPLCYAVLNWFDRRAARSMFTTRRIQDLIDQVWSEFENDINDRRSALQDKARFLKDVAELSGTGSSYVPAFLALPVSLTVGTELSGLFEDFTATQTRIYARALWEEAVEQAPDFAAWLNGYCAEHPENQELCYLVPGMKDAAAQATKQAALLSSLVVGGSGGLMILRSGLSITRIGDLLAAGARWAQSVGSASAARLSQLASSSGFTGSITRFMSGAAGSIASRGLMTFALLEMGYQMVTHGGAQMVWNSTLSLSFYLIYLSFCLLVFGVAVFFAIYLPVAALFRGQAEIIKFFMTLAGLASIPILSVLGFLLLNSVRRVYINNVVPLVGSVFESFAGGVMQIPAKFLLIGLQFFLHLGAILTMTGILYLFAFLLYRRLAQTIIDAPSIKVGGLPFVKG